MLHSALNRYFMKESGSIVNSNGLISKSVITFVDGDRTATTVLDGDMTFIIVQNISFQLLPGRLQ